MGKRHPIVIACLKNCSNIVRDDDGNIVKKNIYSKRDQAKCYSVAEVKGYYDRNPGCWDIIYRPDPAIYGDDYSVLNPAPVVETKPKIEKKADEKPKKSSKKKNKDAK